jgi:pyrimidine operon attenuation protein/uracil phosphoribosyltransferase
VTKAREILSAAAIGRALARMASEIVERNGGVEELALVGIQTRGVPLARRIARRLADPEEPPVGMLDITLHRDDLALAARQPIVRATQVPFTVEEKVIVLVDDVLFTGRTVRAALDSLVALGRPRRIQLAVLIDRGHRELPIAADYVGRHVQTSPADEVSVRLAEVDGVDQVTLGRREA